MDPSRQVHFQAQLLKAAEQPVIANVFHGVVTYWNRCAERQRLRVEVLVEATAFRS
jgi:hypothetical protein